jgi:hypothetical protein
MNSGPTTPGCALIQGYDCFTLATAPVTHRLDPVAVGVAQERAVIGGMMVVQAGWSVIGAAGGDAGVPERSNV